MSNPSASPAVRETPTLYDPPELRAEHGERASRRLLCEEQLGVPEDEFWSLVRGEIIRHQTRFPELKDRHEMFDLLTPRIERLCLNRSRLHLDGCRDRPARPRAAVHGTVPNPLRQS